MIPRLTIAFLGIGAFGLAACAPPTEDNVRTRQGALLGAAIGGAAGALSGDRDDRLIRTAVGAGIGAAAGGAIGATLDRQAAELRRDLGGNVDVRNTGSELIVTMPQDILFDFDSATVRPDLQRDLRVLADSLNRYPDRTVRVVGHTDNVGTAAYNQNLSERRAAAVGGVLRNSGVDGRRIVTQGRGFTQPIASNATPEGRRQNRRVEIYIIPNV
jgi:outer membrane protein OmpA-like peptidoglycan-associated protein